MWRGTILLIDKAFQFATAKTYVFSDSVPRLGVISTEPVKAVESEIKWFLETRYFFKNWIGSTENRWNSSRKFTRILHFADSRRDTKDHDFGN